MVKTKRNGTRKLKKNIKNKQKTTKKKKWKNDFKMAQ